MINPMVILVLLLVLPLVFAVLIALRPDAKARATALLGSLLCLLLAVTAMGQFDWSDGAAVQASGTLEWLPAYGLNLSIGVDAVGLLLIALTAFLGPLCVACSWTGITSRQRLFFAWLMVLQTAMYGVFMAQDMVVFYVCFEFTLVPMYVLINVFGSTNRKHAATKFFLYTFTGSLIALAGLTYVAWYHAIALGAGWSWAFADLAVAARQMSGGEQGWVLLALLAGFAVKVPLFPVHTWLPLAHTEAPTAGSVILAGVLLKLGTYAIYKFVLGFVPAAVFEYGTFIGVLAVIGIVYAGLICWVQTDVKKLVAYSSVSHLGFCVLGLVALNAVGLQGSILYMINHGLSTGALFLCVGMIYERYHTRDMRQLGGLAKRMPVWSFFMVFFVMASVGLPGTNGFISELYCLVGAFQASDTFAEVGPGMTPGHLGPWFAAVAGTGMVVAAIYLLYMTGLVVFGPLKEPKAYTPDPHRDHREDGPETLPIDLNLREICTLAPVAVLCLALGLYPKILTGVLEAPVNAVVNNALVSAGYLEPVDDDGPTDPGVPYAAAVAAGDPLAQSAAGGADVWSGVAAGLGGATR